MDNWSYQTKLYVISALNITCLDSLVDISTTFASATSIKNCFGNSDEEELPSSVNESEYNEEGRSSETVIHSDKTLLFLFEGSELVPGMRCTRYEKSQKS